MSAMTALRRCDLACGATPTCRGSAACPLPAFSLELSAKLMFLASWRPRACLQTGLLAPKTASDGRPGVQDKSPSAKDAFYACTLRTVFLVGQLS